MRAPRPGPGIGLELSLPQQLACALRILAAAGWRENMSGHITWACDDGGMWCNPWGLWWEEVRASHIIRLDTDGAVVEGAFDVTPAVSLHTELHRSREDATIIVHNHPYYATLLACMAEPPRIVHQNAALFDGELAFVDEYSGIEGEADGQWLADRAGKATGILLAHHGAIVTGQRIEDACYRAVTFERMCRFTYDILQSGREPIELSAPERAALKPALMQNAPRVYWEGTVRQLLAREPEVLE